MRTTKRFTPALLDRYRALGRGTGTYNTYLPWHRVGRSDPASRGRSHLHMWRGRQREFLSDLEWVGFLFATMHRQLDDVLEQFPLSLEAERHELSRYDSRADGGAIAGTREMAERLGARHPKVTSAGRTEPWVMTTDQLLIFRSETGAPRLLATSFKYPGDLRRKRARELLEIERLYWSERGVEWRLVTPDQFDPQVALTLRNAVPWGLGEKSSLEHVQTAIAVTKQKAGHPLSVVLSELAATLGSMDCAQRSFWQAVWSGDLPLDLTRGWRPHEPIRLLPPEKFWERNPIVAGRSAWK